MALTDDISELQTKISKRVRQDWSFDADNFLVPFSGISGQYRMRVLTVKEEMIAKYEAKKISKEMAKETGLDNDPEFFNKLEIICFLQKICLRQERDLPLFSSPHWMLDNFNFNEIEVLWNHYQECLRLSGTLKLDLDAESAEGLAVYLANTDSSKSLDILMRFANPQLALLAILLSIKIDVLKKMNVSNISKYEASLRSASLPSSGEAEELDQEPEPEAELLIQQESSLPRKPGRPKLAGKRPAAKSKKNV